MLKDILVFISCQCFCFQQWARKIVHFKLKKHLSLGFVYVGVVCRQLGKRDAGLSLVLKGRRIYNIEKANFEIYKAIRNDFSELESLLPISANVGVDSIARRILILKIPKLSNGVVKEKGAIVIKFSETFSEIYHKIDVNYLSFYFNIILEPSYVGYSLPEILVWTKLSPTKVFLMAPYLDDYNFISGLDANLVPLKLGPSDWVNTNIFFEIPDTLKFYDAIYVANYNPSKRVERFIKAVSIIQKKRPEYRAALILADHGKKKSQIDNVIKFYENRVDIDYFGPMSQSELNVMFNRSKANLLISFREGSNKGLAEGLFSGVPGLLIAENSGGNHAHINDLTGKVVPDSTLEDAMIWFSDNYEKLSPSTWVQRNMSPPVSANEISKVLKKIEIEEGREWETDLIPKINSPELSYFSSEADWLLEKRVELLDIFSDVVDNASLVKRMDGFASSESSIKKS